MVSMILFLSLYYEINQVDEDMKGAYHILIV